MFYNRTEYQTGETFESWTIGRNTIKPYD